MWPFKKQSEDDAAHTPPSGPVAEPSSIRCATANVVVTPPAGGDGRRAKRGAKNFRGGAKVYLIGSYPGLCEAAIVIGHHRGSGRYITLTMRAKYLEDFRVTTVYSPEVIKRIRQHCVERCMTWPEFEALAQHLCDSVGEWAETERGDKESSGPESPPDDQR